MASNLQKVRKDISERVESLRVKLEKGRCEDFSDYIGTVRALEAYDFCDNLIVTTELEEEQEDE